MNQFAIEAGAVKAMMIAARVGAIFVFAPVFGGTAVSARIKAGLTLAITALLFPLLPTPAFGLDSSQLAMAMLGEAALGLLAGLSLQLVLEAAQLAGHVAGFQMGFSLVNVIDPQSEVDTPVLSVLHGLIVTLIFLRLEVHHWLLRGVVKSFTWVPAGSVAMTGVVKGVLLKAGSAMWLAGVQMAAPVLLATVVTDVALGLLGRASPQLPVLFVSLSVKNIVGALAMIGSLAFWPGLLERWFAAAMGAAEAALRLGH